MHMPTTESPTTAAPALGVTLGPDGGELRVWSSNATTMNLHVLSEDGSSAAEKTVAMEPVGDGTWIGQCSLLVPGRRYALSADGPAGPTHRFDPTRLLLDPYARGVERTTDGVWVSAVVEEDFDWGGIGKPDTLADHSVIYETHVKGFSMLNELLPYELRGTYAGLGHEVSIAYLRSLGITAVELLPVHAFVSEERLQRQRMVNYWGYNTLAFFAPHAEYATKSARAAGPTEVLREFKTMVRQLHQAGIEVYLDVVYNHTAEEGPGGPTTSFRGLDNAAYYRQDANGNYIDTTGCGNTLDFSQDVVVNLTLDSLRYWAAEVQIDGFRFDLATTLARDDSATFRSDHPFLTRLLSDPALSRAKKIAEPWDIGIDGWKTGSFPKGIGEWNDRYRDRMRDFWLCDIARARSYGDAGSGIGRFATRFAGSSNTFSIDRGPLASVNFITAHDGFTMADLTAYNVKHNLLNGENNRDGTDNNLSFNHGYEGPSSDPRIEAARRKAIRNLLGTLLLSAGVPMMSAGDEFGRSQQGNNNAYCQDNEISWLPWLHEPWQQNLLRVTQQLIRLRKENPALRPRKYGRLGEIVPNASKMEWFDGSGASMEEKEWNSPLQRTLQYLATSTPQFEPLNRILCVVHALEDDTIVTLPTFDGITHYELLWDSVDEAPRNEPEDYGTSYPGHVFRMAGTSMRLYRARGTMEDGREY